MKKRLLAVIAIAVSAALLVGCGSGSESKETADLVFSNVEVECSNRDGLFGGRYALFKATGSVTNKSGNPVDKDDMPRLVASGENGEEIKAELSQDKLLDGETCDITYEHEFDITRSELPALSVSCNLSTEGFNGAIEELNTKLGAVAEDYANKDAEEEAERKEAQEKEQREKKAAEEAKKAVEACKGKTADEGLKIAKDAHYFVTFEDRDGVDVTSYVEDGGNQSDVHSAKITSVEVLNFLGDFVTFTLDYEDLSSKCTNEENKKDEAGKVLNASDCEDLNILLEVSDPGDPFVAEFAEKYDGCKIEFDGVVTSWMRNGSQKTRFDYLISAGDNPDAATRGPNFKYENIAYTDFKWKGESPDSVPVGTKIHCISEIVRYEDSSQLFFLKPVETSLR